LQDCDQQATQVAQAAFKAAAAPGKPRQEAPPLPPPSCLSATLFGGGAAGGVGSGRLLDCLVGDDDGSSSSSSSSSGGGSSSSTRSSSSSGRSSRPNVRGSAYLSIKLSGCYLTEGSVGLLDSGGGPSVADAWPYSSAPAAPVGLVLGNFSSTPIGGGGGGPVRLLTPGAFLLACLHV
jgi:hypothetical protein